jgi:hypothetical protein
MNPFGQRVLLYGEGGASFWCQLRASPSTFLGVARPVLQILGSCP